MQAIRRYLELKGFDILEDGWCHGKDAIDFIATDEGIPDEHPDRRAHLRMAAAYLSEAAMENSVVRFDIVSVLIIGESRALLRHHVNALNTYGVGPRPKA